MNNTDYYIAELEDGEHVRLNQNSVDVDGPGFWIATNAWRCGYVTLDQVKAIWRSGRLFWENPDYA